MEVDNLTILLTSFSSSSLLPLSSSTLLQQSTLPLTPSSIFDRILVNVTEQFVTSISDNDGLSAASASYDEDEYEIPQIPAYIRITSMVLCILIMCLGVIGNIMVSMILLC